MLNHLIQVAGWKCKVCVVFGSETHKFRLARILLFIQDHSLKSLQCSPLTMSVFWVGPYISCWKTSGQIISENVHSFHWLMFLPSIQQRDVQPWTMEEYMEKNSRITEWKKRVRYILWHVSFGQICTQLDACSISAPLAYGWTSLLAKVTINVVTDVLKHSFWSHVIRLDS